MKIVVLDDAAVQIKPGVNHLRESYAEYKASAEYHALPLTFHQFVFQILTAINEMIAGMGGRFAMCDFSLIMKKSTSCSHCDREWNLDESGKPACCDDARLEWDHGKREEMHV